MKIMRDDSVVENDPEKRCLLAWAESLFMKMTKRPGVTHEEVNEWFRALGDYRRRLP
jgi:hypothetical protein